MPSILETLRAASDPTRLRILLLLKEEELSVAEVQEVLALGQSRISTNLQQLKQAGLAEDRRAGKSIHYRLATERGKKRAPKTAAKKGRGRAESAGDDGPEEAPASFLGELLTRAAAEVPEATADRAAMRRVVKKREERMRAFFDEMAGRLGKDYVPGKSWKSFAEGLLRLLPRLTIADVGAGDGSTALFLAQRAATVIAVDSSEKMLEVGRKEAKKREIANVEFRQGDFESLPIDQASVDVVVFSQSLHHAIHPARALAEAARVLGKGGRVLILDLARHRFEEARELYADQWLGFPEVELEEMLQKAGFRNIEIAVVDKDPEAPQFQTLMAVGERA